MNEGIKNSKNESIKHENGSHFLNFIFLNEGKSKSMYRILNFVFQFIKNTKWPFGYTTLVHHLLKIKEI